MSDRDITVEEVEAAIRQVVAGVPERRDAGYVPTLLDYAYLIEWLNDKPDDAPMPERFKPLLDDALERARLGYLARIMGEQ